MSAPRNELREVVREDERRRRDEAKIIALQQQVDELRLLVRELMSRQGRNEEQFKNYEVGLSQVRQTVEQHRHEVSQSVQARQMEDARVRQQITELDARIDETGRPMRSLQAHVADLLEAIRRGRDDNQDELRRHEELRTIIEHVAAVSERNAGVIQVTRDSLDVLRADLEQLQRDLLKAEDATKIVEQELRRRFAEIGQETHNLSVRIEEMRPIFGQLEAMIEDVRHSIVHVDPALEELARVDSVIQEEVARFYGQSVERDDLLAERLDEIRRYLDTQVRDLRQIVEQRFERASARAEALNDVDRELSYRLNMIEMRLDELRNVDLKLRRELWHMHETSARRRLDHVQAEVDAVNQARREVEQELAAERTERPERAERNGGVD
jgi:chromosome segregation ATPase